MLNALMIAKEMMRLAWINQMLLVKQPKSNKNQEIIQIPK